MTVLLTAFPALAVEVKEVKTPGGLTAWLVEEHSLPMLSARFAFRDAGSSADPKGKEGRAILTTELMFEGAGARDALAFNEALEEKAVRLSINADADLFSAQLQTLTEHRDAAFALLSDALTKPRFEPAAIERTRARALAFIKAQEENPGHALERAFNEAAFPGHPYSRPEEGTQASVRHMRKEDFAAFTRRYLTRENLIIAVAGDITPEQLAPLLDKSFASLPARFEPEAKIEQITIPQATKPIMVTRDIPQTMVVFGLQGIPRDDKDYIAAFVMNQVLGGGGLNSRLGKEIREKRGLTYGISTENAPMLHGALWQGSFATRAEQAKAALDATRELIRDFAAGGPTDEELSDARKYLTGSFMLNIDSNREITSYLISMQLYALGRDYLDKRNAMIDAVTKEDVKRVAARLLKADAMTVVVVGKPDAGGEKSP